MKKVFKKYGFPILLLAIVLAFIGFSYLLDCLGPQSVFNKYGDTINALFSSLAFGVLIYTIILQREDLDMQRQQIEKSIAAQDKSNLESQKQNENIELQRFDSTYFKLVSNSQNSLSSIRYKSDNQEYIGSAVFSFFIDKLFSTNSDFRRVIFVISSNNPNDPDLLVKLVSRFDSIQEGYYQVFQLPFIYINTLLFIIDKIKSSQILSDQDRSFYFNYLVANLSNSCKEYLFYRFLFEKAPKLDLQPIIELIDYKSHDFKHKKSYYPNINLVGLLENKMKNSTKIS
jgi:hypothetical protein